MPQRTVWLVIGFLVASVIAIAFAVYIVAGPVIPRSQLRQLRQGMTKSEVRALLGSPQTADGEQEWVYSRWGNRGWVQVYFDAEGRLDRVNDESPFPLRD